MWRRPTRAVTSCWPLLIVPLTWSCTEQPAPEVIDMFRGGAEHRGVYSGSASGTHGIVAWSFQTGGAVRSSPTPDDDRVYVGSGDGHLYALDRITGEEVWSFDAGSAVHSTPAVRSDLIFFGDRANRFYAVDRGSGALRWQVETGPDHPWAWGYEGWDYFLSSPAVTEEVVVVGSGDGAVYAFDAATGSEAWRVATEGRVRSSPAIVGDRVFVGSADGHLYAIDLADGEVVWRFETGGVSLDAEAEGVDRRTVQASPAWVDGVVYFGTRDGHVYAVDAEAGTQVWRSDGQMPWYITSPAVDGGRVFNGNSDGLFVNALSAGTGEELWRTSTGDRVFSSPAVSDGTLYVGNHAGRFLAMDPATGDVKWELRAGSAIMSSPVPDDGFVYYGSDDGRVYSVRLEEGPTPIRAVYWDEERLPLNIQVAHEELRDFFVSRGYRVVDGNALADLMSEAVAEPRPSVVVFAQDHIPGTVAPVPADTTLAMRYLRAGGKIVWLSLPPFYVSRDEGGTITGIDRTAPERFLGVDMTAFDMDRFDLQPTEDGNRWGLSDWWMGWSGVPASSVSTVLAVDEEGSASSWVQSYGGPAGTGFVFLWGTYLPPDLDLYDDFWAVAEYGIGVSPGP